MIDDIPGLILAGGRSLRMGQDKARLMLGGRMMPQHVHARLSRQIRDIALNAPEEHKLPLGCPIVPDSMPGKPGPLAGIHAGLEYFRSSRAGASHMLSVPVDTPFFPGNLAELLSRDAGPDEIVIASSGGRLHPVVGLWPLALTDDLANWLADKQNRKVQSFIARHRTRQVDFPFIPTHFGPLDPFFNINSPEDFDLAGRYLAELSI